METECLDPDRCGSENEMLSAPSVGSNREPDSHWAKGACGAMLLAAGTYAECNRVAVAHRNEVRATRGLPPTQSEQDEG